MSASDRIVPQTRYVARLGLPNEFRLPAFDVSLGEWFGYVAQLASLHHMDKSSGICCQDGGFRYIVCNTL